MTPDAQSRSGSTREVTTWSPGGRAMDARDRSAILRRTVQLQVIPQLLQRCPTRQAQTVAPSPAISVEGLAALALQTDAGPVVECVTDLVESGWEAEAILEALLAPTARLLGDFWVDDLCTFADVTIGTGHLQAGMRALRPAFLHRGTPIGPDAPRALLLPQTGEQHNFGVRMLSAFFARAGWDVWSDGAADTDAADIARRDWVDLVGISVSGDAMLDAAGRTIAAIRAASLNRAIAILVGGLPFTLDPSLAQSVGADGTAADGPSTIQLATTMLADRRGDAAYPPDGDSSA